MSELIKPSFCPARNEKYNKKLRKKYDCCPRNLLATNAVSCDECSKKSVDSLIDTPTKIEKAII